MRDQCVEVVTACSVLMGLQPPVSATGPQRSSHHHQSQHRDTSMGNQSAGGITRGGGGGGGGGLDLLGVINMIQIFTLSGHLAECRGRPASCSTVLNTDLHKH